MSLRASLHYCVRKIASKLPSLYVLPVYISLLWLNSPTRAKAASFLRFLEHTFTREISMLPAGFESAIPASERPQNPTARPLGSAASLYMPVILLAQTYLHITMSFVYIHIRVYKSPSPYMALLTRGC